MKCIYCSNKHCESKGWRTNTTRKYYCIKCNKYFTIYYEKEENMNEIIMTEIDKPEKQIKQKQVKLVTVNASANTKGRLNNLKLHHRETLDDVIVRLLDFWEEEHSINNRE